MDIAGQKSALRREAMDLRRRLHEAAPEAGAAIAQNFLKCVELADSVPVAGYLPTRHEADPRALMESLRNKGFPILLPRVAARNAPLAFHLFRHDAHPVEGAFGLNEPAPEWPQGVPDVLLIPVLAFDEKGYRLGYGGGYYDRTLKALRAAKNLRAIGIAFSGQERALPHDEHDERLDGIVTEKGCRIF